jgi:GT2 family glycosyltransferase/glycosyltransferase involved in cell wall biosynthesis
MTSAILKKTPGSGTMQHYAKLLFPAYTGPRIARYFGGPWSMHLPFAYDLMREFRPSSFVELGVYKGESYFTFCQSAAENGVAVLCYGIDTWQGDPQTGFYGPAIGHDVATHNTQYATFSQLITATFEDAVKDFPDGSIDLLHIDGAHRYADVKGDFESWCTKLSQRGIVLFHDVMVRDREFGVSRLWTEIAGAGQSFLFPFGHGLGVWSASVTRKGDSKFVRKLFRSDPREQSLIIERYAAAGAALSLWAEGQQLRQTETQLQHAIVTLQDTETKLQTESDHKSELLDYAAQRDQAKEKLIAQLERQSRDRVDQLTADLNRQLWATKKLARLLDDVEDAARRLRSSRRWRIANPFAALKAILRNKPELLGYGHLDKIVSDYSKWCSDHSELKRIEERIQALNQQMARSAIGKKKSLKLSAPYEPPLPARPIEFPACEAVEVSIIIPVYNQLRFTQACLASIQEHQAEHSVEVIVVNDCSTDGTRQILEKIPGLVYLRNEKNLGFVASCNRAAAHARGNYLVFLNNDTVVTENWLSTLRETFDLEPNAGLVGSKLIYPDGRLQEAGGIIWRDGSGWNRGKFDDPRKPEYNFLREVDYCSAACLMLPKSLFQSIGGFDSRYIPAYYEDTDLAFKVRAAGFKVLYQPLSEVFHFEGATGGTDISTGTKKHQEINRKAFAAKWKEALATKPANGDVAALEQLPQGYKRILVIDNSLPMPDRDSGSLRMFQILTILSHLGHRVSFIPDNLSNIPPYADELRKRGIEVIERPHISRVSEYLKLYGSKFDVVILSRCGTARRHINEVRLRLPAARVIFDTVDLHFLRAVREAELTGNLQGKMLAQEMKQQEHQLLNQADETWVVSEAERELLLQDSPGKNIQIISNIVEIREPTTSFAARADFLFIGSFLHPPNIDAVLYFVNDIYSLVVERLPGVKFYVIGSNPPAEIVALGSTNIIVTGQVPDVRPCFDAVKLSIAPIRYGAGVKGKINQSMGFGVPVIATSIAVEGMCLRDRQDVLIADKPEEFASALIDLYQSEDLWRRLSGNSLKKTKSLYSADAATRKLSRLFSESHIAESTPLSIVNREKTYPTR